jgi:DNA-binding response OmpR family regulator
MPRILLVEDDADVRTLMEHVLIGEGYAVDPTGTAAAARRLLREHDYDLLVADGVLPDGTGMEIADEAEQEGTPVIIVTAYGFLLHRFDRNIARFKILLKPVRPDELLRAVGEALRAER